MQLLLSSLSSLLTGVGPRKSNSRLVSTRKVLDSAKVTGDIGYKPIKDLKRKREGKKAITKQVLPERSAVKPKSKALGIQTRAQTGQELPKQSAVRTRSMALGIQTRHKLENLQSG
ncbi:hypothetical protein FXO38_36270 [Capsicum annuum]|nr:hypothetical protein FXO38_36270 [Capsicum annuum]KAF3613725.1 hypothetical protein FXO37_36250 [Capsicum annuum]